MIRRGRLWVQRSNACQRIGVTRPGSAQQILRALVLHLEVGPGGERFDERRGRAIVFGRHDDTSRERVVPVVRERRTGGSSGYGERRSRRQVGASLPRGRGASCTHPPCIVAPEGPCKPGGCGRLHRHKASCRASSASGSSVQFWRGSAAARANVHNRKRSASTPSR